MAKSAKRSRESGRAGIHPREAYWREILKEQESSGLNHSDFCESKGISRDSYFWWKREVKLRDAKRRKQGAVKSGSEKRKASKTSTPTLVPVRVAEAQRVSSSSFEIILTNQRIVRVPKDFDAGALRRLVLALEEKSAC